MQRQVPGGLNQANVNTIRFNANKEDNVLVLRGEEWEDLFGNSMEIYKL